MTDLSKLSRKALAAAMRGGTDGWGQFGSSTEHVRYSEPLERRRGRRRRCWCGCGNRVTHRGMANGVALTCACELGIARWVKTGHVKPPHSRSNTPEEDEKKPHVHMHHGVRPRNAARDEPGSAPGESREQRLETPPSNAD